MLNFSHFFKILFPDFVFQKMQKTPRSTVDAFTKKNNVEKILVACLVDFKKVKNKKFSL